MTKRSMIESILEDIKANEYESKELLYDLAKQGLERMTTEDIQNTYFQE